MRRSEDPAEVLCNPCGDAGLLSGFLSEVTMTCRELMTSDPVFCVPGDTAVAAATMMKSHDVGSVPVVSDRESKQVVGMITDRDIAMRVVAGKRESDKTHVGDVMSKDV